MLKLLASVLTLTFALTGCGESPQPESSATSDSASAVNNTANATALTVYKSPTCGCCEDWITHMEGEGFEAAIEHPSRMATIKAELGIAPEYGSCHTGVSEEGYVFEGHVPAKLVRQFLDNPPENALGLAVPRMPVGSPGMEMGERFDPYDVLLLKTDGSSEIYARIETPEQQY
ncbi:DUF411 domain-containing protein [Marinimicrobium sp. C6131]|uniref:DUF411 domain-containing protein n=1 Tax=Marinimicrobium sp. C6131 TaxID=3022676 RepID=UPI00223E2C44|nr:DUF411 domain-containing protein [Marinimicrobium sp. C6131]UZJ42997.1 DUF411 domain-containing protein [Marinimicrobium sp. C6131]